MPYAANDTISQDPIDGGIVITDEQYADALNGMLDGKVVSVIGGLLVVDFPQEPVKTQDQTSSENIVNVPTDLFGGPTLEEVFNGN